MSFAFIVPYNLKKPVPISSRMIDIAELWNSTLQGDKPPKVAKSELVRKSIGSGVKELKELPRGCHHG